jgi:hypothetical protein
MIYNPYILIGYVAALKDRGELDPNVADAVEGTVSRLAELAQDYKEWLEYHEGPDHETVVEIEALCRAATFPPLPYRDPDEA